jgi:hypothetical protein
MELAGELPLFAGDFEVLAGEKRRAIALFYRRSETSLAFA